MLSQSLCRFGEGSALGYEEAEDWVVECCNGGG
jgi:hypothetical protein